MPPQGGPQGPRHLSEGPPRLRTQVPRVWSRALTLSSEGSRDSSPSWDGSREDSADGSRYDSCYSDCQQQAETPSSSCQQQAAVPSSSKGVLESMPRLQDSSEGVQENIPLLPVALKVSRRTCLHREHQHQSTLLQPRRQSSHKVTLRQFSLQC